MNKIVKKTLSFLIALNFFYSIECFSEFKIYDATLYKNKPSLNQYKIKTIPIIYENVFFGKNKSTEIFPGISNIKKAVSNIKKSGSNIIILDIERWEVKGNADLAQKSVNKYIKVIDNIRQQSVESLIGYYGLPPIRDYWRAVSGINSMAYKSWAKENDAIQLLTAKVDVIFPSIYTFYSDQVGWEKYAIAQISEARRLGGQKPVFVFLWPQYHDSNKILGGRYIPTEFWRLQLETVKQHADGIVIWGGWQQNWDANAPWWLETLKFMEEKL